MELNKRKQFSKENLAAGYSLMPDILNLFNIREKVELCERKDDSKMPQMSAKKMPEMSLAQICQIVNNSVV